jgi:hypothetical protein
LGCRTASTPTLSTASPGSASARPLDRARNEKPGIRPHGSYDGLLPAGISRDATIPPDEKAVNLNGVSIASWVA